jgi:hypothetical protein
MPRVPIDYSKTLMYKIFKPDETDIHNIYIGHTTDFTKRKNAHKTCCNNSNEKSYNQKNYRFIRDNGGWECFLMRQIEEYPCKNKREAEAREEELRIELGAKLNSKRALSTPDAKKEDAEKYKEYQRQYRLKKKLNLTAS